MRNGNRRLGLWPPNGAVATPETPGHPAGHPADHPEDGCDGQGSSRVAIPDTSNQRSVGNKYVKEVGMGVQMHGEKTLDALGVPTPSNRSNPNSRKGFEESGEVARGVAKASGVATQQKPRPFMRPSHNEPRNDDDLHQLIWSETKKV